MIAKSSFECFVTKRVYEELHLLKPILRNFKSHINKNCKLVAFVTTLLMFAVTQMIPQEILNLLLLIN